MPEQFNIRYSCVLRMVAQLFDAEYSFEKKLANAGNPYFLLYNNDPSFVMFKKITEAGHSHIYKADASVQ